MLIAVAVALSGCGGGAMGPAPPIDKATYVPPQAELMARWAARRARDRQGGRAGHGDRVCLAHLPALRQVPADLFPRMKKEFIDTGKVRYIVREFPIGRTAGAAAIVNRCAPEEKYFFLLEPFLTRQSRMGEPGSAARRHLRRSPNRAE